MTSLSATPLSYRRLVGGRSLNWVHVTNVLHTAKVLMYMCAICAWKEM